MVENKISKELMDILACPTCKGDLKYKRTESSLFCTNCGVKYPIKDGIPILLPKK